MGTNKLIVTVLMSFLILTLSACKQGGNNNKTPVRKAGSNKAATKPVTDPSNSSQDLSKQDQSKKSSPATTAGKITPAAGANNNPSKPSEDGVTGKENLSCGAIEQSAKSHGWKVNSLEVAETSGSTKKIRIVYYTLEKSDLSNPVLYFNRNAFQNADATELERLAKIANDYKLDFVLMDMRGSGCSGALPDIKTKTAELKNYSSRYVVADAEEIRKKILKDNKWKIMAHRSGGAVALRYVQLFPKSVK